MKFRQRKLDDLVKFKIDLQSNKIRPIIVGQLVCFFICKWISKNLFNKINKFQFIVSLHLAV
jgi:hypothetical protein